MKTVKIELPDEDADALERVAVDGGFASSSEFVLAAIGDLITAPIAYDPDAWPGTSPPQGCETAGGCRFHTQEARARPRSMRSA